MTCGVGMSGCICITCHLGLTSLYLMGLLLNTYHRGLHAPGIPGTFFPPTRVSDPDMHHGTCVTHVPWCMPGSLPTGFLGSRWLGKCSRHSRRIRVTARFVTRFNLWLRHDLWPHNASICDPARFVTKSASICDQRYTMILESKLCRGKLVFVFTLIMYTKWYNMIIYIYELWYNTYINSGARSLMLFTLILFEYHAWHIYIIYHICVSYFMHHP